MADEQKPPEATGGTPPPAPPPAPAPPSERMFTQTELNTIVQRRLQEEREKAKAPPAPEAPKGEAPKSNEQKPDELATLQEQLSALSQRLEQSESDRSFAEKVAGVPLTPEQREILRTLWNPQKPETVEAAIKAFGVGAAKPNEPVKPTYQSPGAPNGAPESSMEHDATKWSADYVARLRQEGTFLKELDKYRQSLPGGGSGLFRKQIPKAG